MNFEGVISTNFPLQALHLLKSKCTLMTPLGRSNGFISRNLRMVVFFVHNDETGSMKNVCLLSRKKLT